MDDDDFLKALEEHAQMIKTGRTSSKKKKYIRN